MFFFYRVFFIALLQIFEIEKQNFDRTVDLRLKSVISLPTVRHIRAADKDCGHDWMLTFYVETPTKHIAWLVNDTITLAMRGPAGSGVIISLRQVEQTNKRYPPSVIIGSQPTL